MTWLLKRDLPSVKENIKTISESLFEIIHKYATGQNCTGDYAELVMSAFKVNNCFNVMFKYLLSHYVFVCMSLYSCMFV